MASKNKMTSKLQHLKNLRQIFQCSVESVRPKNLLSAANNYNLEPTEIKINNGRSFGIQIQGKTIDIDNKKCYVVGFGKAVLGMAVQIERSLGHHLTSGIISIPLGTQKQFQDVDEMLLKTNSKIQVYEGAPNNQPDEVALDAARKIKSLAKAMTSDDILFVLISGGGSALLPLPRTPMTLNEKTDLIRALANHGATIQEMNTVRIALSDTKGGRLAAAASNASAVISFIISDIVGDPVDLIASAPTCGSINHKSTAKQILKDFDMWENLSESIKQLIKDPVDEKEIKPGSNNMIYVVGDNRIATAAAVKAALQCGYNPFIASTILQGNIQHIALMYKDFLESIFAFRSGNIYENELKCRFPFDPRNFQHFLKTLLMCQKANKPLLLILAGEPTVKVEGSGLGGRNQELALRMSLELYNNSIFKDVAFLSAGTDGIDGPTPAAGAIGCKEVVEDFLDKDSLNSFITLLENNDSYNFYNNLNNGVYHVITGHTGTNVMDLHFILIP